MLKSISELLSQGEFAQASTSSILSRLDDACTYYLTVCRQISDATTSFKQWPS